MFNLSLTACSFYIREIKSSDNIYCLNKELEVNNENNEKVKFQNVSELFKLFFESFKDSIKNDEIKKTFNCHFEDSFQGEEDDYYYIYTIIKSGGYGSSSEIKNVDTHQIVYSKKPNEAEERPFYLYIAIPKDSDKVTVQKGMFLFQNVGPYGVKTITTDYMKKFFKENFKQRLECKTIAPELFVKKVLKKENIKNIIMIKNHVSGDSSDNVGLGYGVETRVLGNLRFTMDTWNKLSGELQDFAKGKCNLFEFNSVEYNKLKVKAKIGDRERTIDLSHIDNLSIIEAIPDEIREANGHPNEEKLIEHFKATTKEYLKEMVLHIK